ncbi:MAG: DUF2194 domain-containing protein [bacterium]|nr:DUF2194 domain-containing protein [bacterium]
MKKEYVKIILPLIALFLCGGIVLLERIGVTYNITSKPSSEPLSFSAEVTQEATCLLLVNEKDEVSKLYEKMMSTVLDDMRISYDVKNANEKDCIDQLDQYESVVITFDDWSILQQGLNDLCKWVKDGGSVMNTMTPLANGSFIAISQKLGISNVEQTYAGVSGFRVLKDCMLGATEEDVFIFDEETEEELLISLSLELVDEAEVYLQSKDNNVPLMWKMKYGSGAFVILNETLTEKYQRGFLCTAYSLLKDVTIYPVINASSYYLDDFPAPVPGGNGEYIKRDYGVDIGTFYSTIWWPRMLQWQKQYNIKHTGLIIEQYSDQVEAPFATNGEVAQFTMYGNMLLNNGGELGLHGYNHMPLCLEGVDDSRQYGDYKLWKTTEDMSQSISELQAFANRLFPTEKMAVYVPPSNIISETGIQVLRDTCPDFTVLSASYMKDAENRVYEQEFTVDETGLIHAPRITSGCEIDQYQMITALSELNFHYVQSHFTHPDDVLDEDRGASLGWEKLSGSLEDYIKWVNKSVPEMRNATGSEMGTAVLQYHNLSVNRRLEGNVLNVSLGGFSNEAYLMLRINEGKPVETEGCEVSHLKGNIYMVHATNDEIKITLGE